MVLAVHLKKLFTKAASTVERDIPVELLLHM
jgi:hypothetical protein